MDIFGSVIYGESNSVKHKSCPPCPIKDGVSLMWEEGGGKPACQLRDLIPIRKNGSRKVEFPNEFTHTGLCPSVRRQYRVPGMSLSTILVVRRKIHTASSLIWLQLSVVAGRSRREPAVTELRSPHVAHRSPVDCHFSSHTLKCRESGFETTFGVAPGDPVAAQ
jgi:hypothetical protein